MSKKVLDIEQMKHLQELGLDISGASMCWWRRIRDFRGEKVEGNWSLSLNKPFIVQNFEQNENIPTFTLQDILDLLPESIDRPKGEFHLNIDRLNNYWYVSYIIYVKGGFCEIENMCESELIDAAYEIFCWCIKNGYVKTN